MYIIINTMLISFYLPFHCIILHRFLRERPDKNPENATSAEQIVEMFLSQGGENGDKMEENDDDDEFI